MTSLQVVLIIAGIALVLGVIVYNWWQERRVRARLDATFTNLCTASRTPAAPPPPSSHRVDPPPGGHGGDGDPMLPRASARPVPAAARAPVDPADASDD